MKCYDWTGACKPGPEEAQSMDKTTGLAPCFRLQSDHGERLRLEAGLDPIRTGPLVWRVFVELRACFTGLALGHRSTSERR